ncbi:MAG: hypothetical protein ACYS8W_02410 [Planctomycetota bacterium]|jgi:hypothetical protein
MALSEEKNPALIAARLIFAISIIVAIAIMAIPAAPPSPQRRNLLADSTFRISYPEEGLGPWRLREGSTGVVVHSLRVQGEGGKAGNNRVIRALFSPTEPALFRLSQTCSNKMISGKLIDFSVKVSAERLTGDVILRLVASGKTVVEKPFSVDSTAQYKDLTVCETVPGNASRVIAVIEAESAGGILWIHNAELKVFDSPPGHVRDTASDRILRQSFLRRFFRLTQNLLK